MMRLSFFLVFLLVITGVTAQTGMFTDPRDGQQYQTITIGNRKWFREHLRYQTRFSYCPNFNTDKTACDSGNYYLNTELDTVCPKGWRVPTIDDWNSYIAALYTANHVEIDTTKSKALPPPRHDANVTFKHFNIFSDTLLKLAPIGWVEGKKKRLQGSLTLWVNDKENSDTKFHVHIGELGFIRHTHDHNIIDKPKRIRKFPVRCVCELPAY